MEELNKKWIASIKRLTDESVTWGIADAEGDADDREKAKNLLADAAENYTEVYGSLPTDETKLIDAWLRGQ